MFYVHAITVPPNTLETAPVEQTLALSRGVIHWVSIGFPRGCSALAHLKVFRFKHQIFPSNEEADLAWDGVNIEWQEHYELLGSPYELLAVAWNDDTLFQHVITVRVGVMQTAFVGGENGRGGADARGEQVGLMPEYV